MSSLAGNQQKSKASDSMSKMKKVTSKFIPPTHPALVVTHDFNAKHIKNLKDALHDNYITYGMQTGKKKVQNIQGFPDDKLFVIADDSMGKIILQGQFLLRKYKRVDYPRANNLKKTIEKFDEYIGLGKINEEIQQIELNNPRNEKLQKNNFLNQQEIEKPLSALEDIQDLMEMDEDDKENQQDQKNRKSKKNEAKNRKKYKKKKKQIPYNQKIRVKSVSNYEKLAKEDKKNILFVIEDPNQSEYYKQYVKNFENSKNKRIKIIKSLDQYLRYYYHKGEGTNSLLIGKYLSLSSLHKYPNVNNIYLYGRQSDNIFNIFKAFDRNKPHPEIANVSFLPEEMNKMLSSSGFNPLDHKQFIEPTRIAIRSQHQTENYCLASNRQYPRQGKKTRLLRYIFGGPNLMRTDYVKQDHNVNVEKTNKKAQKNKRISIQQNHHINVQQKKVETSNQEITSNEFNAKSNISIAKRIRRLSKDSQSLIPGIQINRVERVQNKMQQPNNQVKVHKEYQKQIDHCQANDISDPKNKKRLFFYNKKPESSENQSQSKNAQQQDINIGAKRRTERFIEIQDKSNNSSSSCQSYQPESQESYINQETPNLTKIIHEGTSIAQKQNKSKPIIKSIKSIRKIQKASLSNKKLDQNDEMNNMNLYLQTKNSGDFLNKCQNGILQNLNTDDIKATKLNISQNKQENNKQKDQKNIYQKRNSLSQKNRELQSKDSPDKKIQTSKKYQEQNNCIKKSKKKQKKKKIQLLEKKQQLQSNFIIKPTQDKEVSTDDFYYKVKSEPKQPQIEKNQQNLEINSKYEKSIRGNRQWKKPTKIKKSKISEPEYCQWEYQLSIKQKNIAPISEYYDIDDQPQKKVMPYNKILRSQLLGPQRISYRQKKLQTLQPQFSAPIQRTDSTTLNHKYKYHKSYKINLQNYDRFVENGVTIYRPKKYLDQKNSQTIQIRSSQRPKKYPYDRQILIESKQDFQDSDNQITARSGLANINSRMNSLIEQKKQSFAPKSPQKINYSPNNTSYDPQNKNQNSSRKFLKSKQNIRPQKNAFQKPRTLSQFCPKSQNNEKRQSKANQYLLATPSKIRSTTKPHLQNFQECFGTIASKPDNFFDNFQSKTKDYSILYLINFHNRNCETLINLADPIDTVQIYKDSRHLTKLAKKASAIYDWVVILLPQISEDYEPQNMNEKNVILIQMQSNPSRNLDIENQQFFASIPKMVENFHRKTQKVKQTKVPLICFKDFNQEINTFANNLFKYFPIAKKHRYLSINDLPNLKKKEGNPIIIIVLDEVGLQDMLDYCSLQEKKGFKIIKICIPKSNQSLSLSKNHPGWDTTIWISEKQAKCPKYIIQRLADILA